MKLRSLLYRWARLLGDVEALTSGNPKRIGKRLANKLIGRISAGSGGGDFSLIFMSPMNRPLDVWRTCVVSAAIWSSPGGLCGRTLDQYTDRRCPRPRWTKKSH